MLALAVTACKEEDGEPVDQDKVANAIVTALCNPFEKCDCDDFTVIESTDDCGNALKPAIEAATANAADLALRYHSECVNIINIYFDILDCDFPEEISAEQTGEALYNIARCKLISGSGGRGEPCEVVGGPSVAVPIGDTCKHNLICDGSLCRPFPTAKGDFCGGAGVCPSGLACVDPEAEGVRRCDNPAGEGDECNPHDPAPCEKDTFCDPVDLECKELPGAGDNCLLGMCQEEFTCHQGICSQLPTEGQMCGMTGACDGAYCDPATNLCVPAPGEGQACMNGACGEGLVCTGATCTKRPPAICGVATDVGLCLYEADGICDEPDIGTGLCPEGTDPVDCGGGVPGTTTAPPTTTMPPTTGPGSSGDPSTGGGGGSSSGS